jgi:hypothetical protein
MSNEECLSKKNGQDVPCCGPRHSPDIDTTLSRINYLFPRPWSLFKTFYTIRTGNVREKLEHAKMKFEKNRIESFRNWSVPYIDVREMASNGFYYIEYKDVVECTFCNIQVHDWEADDDIANEHKRWAPYCPFARGLKTDNIELQSKYQ